MHMKTNICAVAVFLCLALAGQAQTTAFTYQGQLNSTNGPATGSYDFRFKIYNAINSVVGVPLTNAPAVVTNGLFTVTLDFGPGVFDGSTRTLEIGVRGYGDTNAYSVLAPRQTLVSVPYAIQSINASNAVVLTAPLQTTNLTGLIPNSLLSTNVAVLTNNVIFSGGVTATNFTGNGYGLLNLPAASLIGTIPNERLSTNVALLNTNVSFSNANFSGSVTGVVFTGSGHGLTNVPGAFFWVTVTGITSQMYPNVGYNCTNDMTPVTIVLPPSATLSPGDTFRVAGVGAAGWIIAQTNGQAIFTGNLSDAVGQNWKAIGPNAFWSDVACSANGIKIVGTANGGNIFVSTNSGVTWTTNGTAQIWSSVATSADGTRMVATVGSSSVNGSIYTSADSGTTWTLQPGSKSTHWLSVASSVDGSRLVAAPYGSNLCTSVNYGTNWTVRDSVRFWTSAASSQDGKKLVAAAANSYIYTSTDYGTNWTAQTNSGIAYWSTVASSSDGSRLVAAVGNGGHAGSIYTSADSGVTWTPNSFVSAQWSSVASSADGSQLVAGYNVTSAGFVYTSSDSGATWLQRLGAPSADWAGVAISDGGSQIVAVPDGGNVYISSLNSTTAGTNGYVRGAQFTTLELEYVGNGMFLPLSHEGTIRAY